MQRVPIPQARFHALVVAVCDDRYAPEDLRTYGPLEDWDVSEIEDMSGAFAGRETFNADLSRWDTGRVTTMAGMFQNAISFQSPSIGAWDTSRGQVKLS